METSALTAPAPAAAGVFERWWRVVSDPRGFFAAMPAEGEIRFLAACTAGYLLVATVVQALGGDTVVGLARLFDPDRGWLELSVLVSASLMILPALVAPYLIDAALYHAVSFFAFGSRVSFGKTFCVVAYAGAPMVLAADPWLHWPARGYALYLAMRGLEEVHGLSATNALLTAVVPLALPLVLRVL